MITITQEIIEKASPGEVLGVGFFKNTPDEVYLSDDKKSLKEVKFVIVRGDIPDWAVYFEDLYNTGPHWEDNKISRTGCKLSSCYLKKILKVDKKALLTYRK